MRPSSNSPEPHDSRAPSGDALRISRNTAHHLHGTLHNVNPWGFLIGVLGALFAVLFAIYALIRVHNASSTRPPAAPSEIPIDLEP